MIYNTLKLVFLFSFITTTSVSADQLQKDVSETCAFYHARAFQDKHIVSHGKSFNMRLADSCSRAQAVILSKLLPSPSRLRAAAMFLYDSLYAARNEAINSSIARFESTKTTGHSSSKSQANLELHSAVYAHGYRAAMDVWVLEARRAGIPEWFEPDKSHDILSQIDAR